MFHRKSDSPAVTFPTEHPHGHVAAHVEAGLALEGPLRWDLYTVAAGPARVMHESYDEHLRYVASAGYDWDDELRFDAKSGQLVGLVLKIGEAGPLSADVGASYLSLLRQRGLPVATRHRDAAHLTPEALRWLSADARELVVLAKGAPAADGSSLRLAVHPSLDLLFHDGQYLGWILHDPLEQLAGASEQAADWDPHVAPRDARHASLVAVLHDYLALVMGPTLTGMERRDPTVEVALEALRARTLELRAHDAVADGLAGRIEELLETFYG
ncbi:MAG TPA: hypothetical protein PKU97_25335 [Kofleriaceae bacterium]|nr:hypothetical protein [Kofleriaceae bacterium]